MGKVLKIEPDKCIGCMQCKLACSWIQIGAFQPAAALIKVHVLNEQAPYLPYTCCQCDEAWCMTACPVNAIAINSETGAKVVLGQTCVGCGLCTIACPFGTVFMDPVAHQAIKCDECGGEPACAMVCPTDCISYRDAPNTNQWMQKLSSTEAG